MIKSYKSLHSRYKLIAIFDFSDTRYLLLLTENYGALTVIEKNILPVEMPIIIFGSSFPSDQEYTQVVVKHMISIKISAVLIES